MTAPARARANARRRLRRYAAVSRKVDELYRRRAEAIRAAYAAGLTVSAIADALGVARKVVYDALGDDVARGAR